MTSDVSIFDLPHVMERIGSYLDRRDRMSCSLVSKAFHQEFKRYIWLRLHFPHRQLHMEETIHSDRIMAIRRNIRWTQKVNIDTQCHQEVLELLPTSCHSLKDLVVSITGDQEDDPDGVRFSPIVDLIAKNARLRTCSIVRFDHLSKDSLGRLAGALSHSQSLTKLVLGFHIVPIPHGWLQCVLQNLPNTLKSLSLEWRRWRNGEESEPFPERNWLESYPNLEIAKLRVELTEAEDETLIQFLKRCPSLKECHVPEMSSNQSLSHFVELLGTGQFPFSLERLNCCMWNDINERQWMILLSALKNHIRSFVIDRDFTLAPMRYLVYEMTRHWSQTLESLKVYNAELVSSPDIQLVLTTCPKLRRLSCFCYWPPWTSHPFQDGLNTFPGLKVKGYGEGSSTNGDRMMDWVCLELERLKLSFTDGRSVFVMGPLISEQEQQVAEGIKRVYEQIGRLEKLKKLTLGWYSSSRFSEKANLDMSLQSGMGHMEKLKMLNTVDINYITKVNIGMEEAQWILDKWPMLKTIRGLKYRYRELIDDGGEPDYFALLRSRRSWLDII